MHHSGLSIQISRSAQAPDRCLESSLRGYPSDAIAVLSLSVRAVDACSACCRCIHTWSYIWILAFSRDELQVQCCFARSYVYEYEFVGTIGPGDTDHPILAFCWHGHHLKYQALNNMLLAVSVLLVQWCSKNKSASWKKLSFPSLVCLEAVRPELTNERAASLIVWSHYIYVLLLSVYSA